MTKIEKKSEEDNIKRENLNNLEFDKDIYNKIYGQEYFNLESKLNSINESFQSYFDKISEEYTNKFQKLTNSYYSFFAKSLKKIQNSFDTIINKENSDKKQIKLIQDYSKKYIDKFQNILNFYEQILANLQNNINVLLNFFDIISDSIEANPIDIFLNKEIKNIINNWMFLKLKIDDYNIKEIINSQEVDDKIKKLIFNACENKAFKMSIDSNKAEEEKLSEINNDKRNYHLSILKVKNFEDYFKNNNIIYPKLKSLYIKNSYFDSNFNRKFPNLEKIQINSCYNFNLDILENLPNNIIEINLDNNGLINSEFNRIFSEYLTKNDFIKRNLKKISFKNNNISKIDFNQLVFSSKNTFHSLKEINVSKNRIYKFMIDPQFFPSLKVINLCYNCLSSSYFKEIKDILILQSGNTFLMNSNLCINYYSNLKQKLDNNIHITDNISITYIPKDMSINYISNIKLHNKFLINLLSLDLSFNHLNNDSLFSFISNNKPCLNIKEINLNGNELNDIFFEKYLDNKFYELFDKLKIIYMNNNLIGDESEINYKDDVPILELYKNLEKIIYKMRLIFKFLKLNKNLKLFSITRNPIGNYFQIKENSEKKLLKRLVYDENNKVNINCFYTFLLKIRDEINYDNPGRKELNIIFDCPLDINKNSNEFNYNENIISFKKNMKVIKN
jgi:hypothetical protein